MGYKAYGLTTLQEILGEYVVYRNLIPADERLPALSELQGSLGLDGRIPRKVEPAYGRVVAEMLRLARALDLPGVEIERLLFIGDTQLNDGTAFRNIRAAGGWAGWCFIGRDALDRPPEIKVGDSIYVTNRWNRVPEFLRFVGEQGFALDERTAVVIDMDKTAIGARGRNDKVINEARVEGVQRTVADLLGPSFDQDAFHTAYDELNQSPYYGLTADNQDYLAYICLMLGAGLFELDAVVSAVKQGTMSSFTDFIGEVQQRQEELGPSGLTSIHDDVWACVQVSDPTPFKAFRYNEYLTTAVRFGDLPGAPVEDALKRRIVVTQEVREAALALRDRGALLFALSDKPDEASVPSERQAQEGMKALHCLETLAVGEI
jgi:catechol 2,3-dioxygenase-like lactoylglutathione lyase family enzyme